MEKNDQKRKILVTCPKRVLQILKNEIEELGYSVISEKETYVEISGTMNDAMKLNLYIRTGYHVHFFIDEFIAKNPDELYQKMKKIEWENYLKVDAYLSINSIVENPLINDSRFPNLKAKDAIVDRLREKWGKRPDTGAKNEGAVIFFYWINEKCSVFLDTSGKPLSKRNYRKNPYKAPMQEALAAAVLLSSNWKRNENFVNPMCGSGTLAIEATLMAINFAPGLLRENFAFMHLKNFNNDEWKKLVSEAKSKIKNGIENKIIASDIDFNAIKAARENAQQAGVEKFIKFQTCDFEKTEIPEGTGAVILNPEYGSRLGEEKRLEKVYERIGDFFKNKCGGYWGYVFTGNFKLSKKIGLRSNRRIPFYNSTIDCRLIEFELYEGSRKQKFSEGE